MSTEIKTAKKRAIDKLYFESICCACIYAPLPIYVDQGANRIYKNDIEMCLPGWYEDRNIPIALKHFWTKRWVLPYCRTFLLEGSFPASDSDVDFFTNLTKQEIAYLIGRFIEIKHKNDAFEVFLNGGLTHDFREPDPDVKPGFLRRFKRFIFNQNN